MRGLIPVVLCALSSLGPAQDPPPEVAGWIAAAEGFEPARVKWHAGRRTLTVTYGQGPQDKIAVVLDGRELTDGMSDHEFWRVPVTWRRRVEEIGGQFVIGGMTDQAAGPDYRGTCGVAWRTREGLRILIHWRPGRGETSGSWRDVARAVAERDRGRIPTGLIRAYLDRHRSALGRNSNLEGPVWAARELRRAWKSLGEELASDQEVVRPDTFPFAIPFLQFGWGQTPEERRARYAELSTWIAAVSAEDFEWDRRSGTFRFRVQAMTGARPVAVPARRAVDPDTIGWLRQDIEWALPLSIVPGSTGLLWTAGRVDGSEWFFAIGEHRDRYELNVFEVQRGRLLMRAMLPFREINHLRFVEGQLFVDVQQDGTSRQGTFDLETLAVTMDVDATPLLRELYPPRQGWEMTRHALGLGPRDSLNSVLVGESGIYVRSVADTDKRAVLRALDRDEHRVRWAVETVVGTPVIERPGIIHARVLSNDWPSWAGLDSGTGAVRWVLGLRDHGLWNAGLSGDRIVLLRGPEAVLLDAGSGRILGRVPLEEDLERHHVDSGRFGIHLTDNGMLVISRGDKGWLRFYRWP